MPSPFPGMDPYLEGSEWTSLHFGLCLEIARILVPKVRPKYIFNTADNQLCKTIAIRLKSHNYSLVIPANAGMTSE